MSAHSAEKIDLFRQHKDEYAATTKPALVRVKRAAYLVVRGHGPPGAELFQTRVGGLYGMAYTVKFQSKFAGRDFVVSKLEGLYGVDGQTSGDLHALPQEKWNWRLMIRVPDFIRTGQVEEAKSALREKGKEGDFDAVQIETIDEGLCVQMLHVGPYEQESQTIDVMLAFAAEQGLTPRLWHHEVYLSDPRRVPPAKLRTILRRPVGA